MIFLYRDKIYICYIFSEFDSEPFKQIKPSAAEFLIIRQFLPDIYKRIKTYKIHKSNCLPTFIKDAIFQNENEYEYSKVSPSTLQSTLLNACSFTDFDKVLAQIEVQWIHSNAIFLLRKLFYSILDSIKIGIEKIHRILSRCG